MPSVTLKFVRPPGLDNQEWNKVANKAYTAARQATPVDTGRLKSSWQETGRTTRSVTLKTRDAIAPYASYVNNGIPARMGKHGMLAARPGQHFTQVAKSNLTVYAGKFIGKKR